MSNRILTEKYHCWNDCSPAGCPDHTASIEWNSVSDSLILDTGKGQKLGIQTNELEAFAKIFAKLLYRTEIENALAPLLQQQTLQPAQLTFTSKEELLKALDEVPPDKVCLVGYVDDKDNVQALNLKDLQPIQTPIKDLQTMEAVRVAPDDWNSPVDYIEFASRKDRIKCMTWVQTLQRSLVEEFKEIVDKIIGENEEKTTSITGHHIPMVVGRNKLKDEQRQRAKELIKRLEDK